MFEKSTWIRLPRNVLVGHGVLDKLGDAVEELYLSGSPLVVTSPSPNELVGGRVRAQLPNPETVVVGEAGFEQVQKVIDTAEQMEAGYLVGLGGGKPIDTAKMASDELGVGFVSVPTAASHDGIVSGRGSIPEGDMRHSVAAEPPLAVVADTGVLADAPWALTTAGCADIISNYTAVADWQLANRLKGVEYSEYAGSLARMTAEMLVDSADLIRPGLEESSWIVVKALVVLWGRDVHRRLLAACLWGRASLLPPTRPHRAREGAPRPSGGCWLHHDRLSPRRPEGDVAGYPQRAREPRRADDGGGPRHL